MTGLLDERLVRRWRAGSSGRLATSALAELAASARAWAASGAGLERRGLYGRGGAGGDQTGRCRAGERDEAG